MRRNTAGERLNRLVRCGLCQGDNATEYAAELRQLAERTAHAKLTSRQSRFFKALADKKRLRILRLLQVREMCVCELMTALELTQPTTSHHLCILEVTGIVKSRKEGRWIFYSLTEPKLVEDIEKMKYF
jgi:DNA-binding transcriptional ArsR family regulator